MENRGNRAPRLASKLVCLFHFISERNTMKRKWSPFQTGPQQTTKTTTERLPIAVPTCSVCECKNKMRMAVAAASLLSSACAHTLVNSANAHPYACFLSARDSAKIVEFCNKAKRYKLASSRDSRLTCAPVPTGCHYETKARVFSWTEMKLPWYAVPPAP